MLSDCVYNGGAAAWRKVSVGRGTALEEGFVERRVPAAVFSPVRLRLRRGLALIEVRRRCQRLKIQQWNTVSTTAN